MIKVTYNKSWSSKCLPIECCTSVVNIHKMIAQAEGICMSSFYLVCNGKILNLSDKVGHDCTLTAHIRILGGKGGFGSMLRAIGARIEKTTNHEACRDLSGRRMRDVNNEKQIGEWLKKKHDKEDERGKAREEKLKRLLNPVHHYVDQGYTTQLQDNASNVEEALKAALQKKNLKLKSKMKHNSEDEEAPSNKKSCLWIGVSDEESELEDSDEIIHENFDLKKSDSFEMSIPSPGVIESDSVTLQTDDNSKLNVQTINKSTSAENQEKPNTPPRQDELHFAEPIDISKYSSAEELEEVGLDRLKFALQALGMKCGGTLQDRAKRLFLTKHTPLDQIEPSLFLKKKSDRKS